jgi:hypothetical protein
VEAVGVVELGAGFLVDGLAVSIRSIQGRMGNRRTVSL